MALNKIIFTCKSITPMFLSGADGTTPELRPPSIKGALRFWWRAMNGHLDLKDLKEQEAIIFGSPDEKGGRSKIIVRCKIISHDEKQNISSISKSEFEGFHYLLYSAYMNNREYLPNLKFEITLSSQDSEHLLSASYAMWLLSNLGGLGTRSRRGGGNFIISDIKDKEQILSDFTFVNQTKNIAELKEYLRKNIDLIEKHFGINLKKKSRKTHFVTFESYNVHIINFGNEGNNFKDSTKALDKIGLEFQSFRDGRNPENELAHKDYHSVKKFIKNKVPPKTLEKANFGLPISYQYRSVPNDKGKPTRANIEGANSGRSASSLIISLNKAGDQFYPIITNFNSRLLPLAGEQLKIASEKVIRDFVRPNNTIKEDFISKLPNISISIIHE